MVVEGPNCLGMTNYVDGIPLTFVETPPVRLRRAARRRHRVAVGRDGGGARHDADGARTRHLAISVSTGNEAASGVEDYVEYLIDDPDDPASIAMIVEQFRKPARFLALAEQARDGGQADRAAPSRQSGAARESAATHTGAMAGDWQLMRAKVERAGVVLVESARGAGRRRSSLPLRCPAAAGGRQRGAHRIRARSRR